MGPRPNDHGVETQPIQGWDVDRSGHELTVWWPSHEVTETPRVFVAEEHDSVHVLVPCAAGEERSRERLGVATARTVRLAAPLGDRQVIDEATGEPIRGRRQAAHAAR